MRNMTLVSQNVKTRASHALYSPATFVATSISLLIFGFLGLTLSPDLTPPDAYAGSQSSKMRVSIAPAASIALEYYDPDSSSYISSNNLNISIDPGSFKTGAVRVTTSTNSPAGMKLSMNDSDTNTSLIEQNDNQVSPTQQVISSITANTTINDATDSTNAFSDNTWGYAIADTTAGSTSAPTVPLTYSQIPTAETQLKETDVIGDSAYIFTAGVRVGRTLPAGTYKDQLTFTVVANPLPETRTIFDIDTMQDMNSDICKNTPTPTTTSDLATALTDITVDGNTKLGNKVPSVTMKDSRDNQTYTVRKLADGNCWMTDNLRLGTTSAITLDSTNSDLTSGRTFTLPSVTTTTGTTWGNQDKTAFVYGGDKHTADNSANYGYLYNWYTATAGARNSSDSSLMGASSGEAADSVCPANWDLPQQASSTTSGVKNYYNLLTRAYSVANSTAGSTKVRSNPLNFAYAGYYSYSNGSLSVGFSGNYWSSTVSNASSAYYLDFGSSYVDPQRNNGKGYGFSVRCVVK